MKCPHCGENLQLILATGQQMELEAKPKVQAEHDHGLVSHLKVNASKLNSWANNNFLPNLYEWVLVKGNAMSDKQRIKCEELKRELQ